MKFHVIVAIEQFATHGTGVRSSNSVKFLVCLQDTLRFEKVHALFALILVFSVVCLFMVIPMTRGSEPLEAVTAFVHFSEIFLIG